MYEKILVPLDGSSRAEAILPHVERIAQMNHSTVIFLRVLRPVVAGDGYKSILLDQTEAENKRRSEDAMAYLAGVCGEFREKGIDARKMVEIGPVVKTIIYVAYRENVDLIAIASHGRTGIPRVFYGSTAAGVINQADRPLLVIRARKG